MLSTLPGDFFAKQMCDNQITQSGKLVITLEIADRIESVENQPKTHDRRSGFGWHGSR
jgi:hypothetical protein